MHIDSTTVFVFDLDGVITDPKDSSVNSAVVEQIHSLLEGEHYVAVNTGRSYDWVEHHLIDGIKQKDDETLFERLLVVCEKGGEKIQWHNAEHSITRSEYALPKDVYQRTKMIFEENQAQFSTMFWDATKQTMATIEKHPQAQIEQFQEQRQTLVKLLNDGIKAEGVKIDPTTVATDVEMQEAGKYAGAHIIYQWVTDAMGISKPTFISFGDSISDYDMARYFAEKMAPSTFIFVGTNPEDIAHTQGVELIIPEQQFSTGTKAYLDTLLA